MDAGPPTFPILALIPQAASGEGTYRYNFSRFDPPTGKFSELEPIPCLDAMSDRPVSMAIDCTGAAYVQFSLGDLWHISTSAAVCTRLPFSAADQGLRPDLALGFAPSGGGEDLYFVATDKSSVPPSPVFGTLDPGNLTVHRIAPFDAGTPDDTHLGGAPNGPLFAVIGGAIDQVDTSSGAVHLEYDLPASAGPVRSFAFWHGTFYLFRLEPSLTTSVISFTPGSSSIEEVASTPLEVLAAGASLCQ